jgi:hypothetical protein
MAYDLTQEQINWLHLYYHHYSNEKIYELLVPDQRVGFTTFRTAMYQHGFKRFNIQQWTEDEEQCLIDHYDYIGNQAMADHLTAKFGRKFKPKQIEKKLVLLGLTRTPEGFKRIRNGYIKKGVYRKANIKRWEAFVSPNGSLKAWKGRLYIKIKGKFIPAAPYWWKLKHGKPPAGHVVWHKDGNSLNSGPDCNNLELITRAEAQARIVKEIHQRPESLKTAVKLFNKLKKQIKNEQS